MTDAMNLPALKPMTLAEFLAWEERQDSRYEFDGFQPVAMTGGTYRHDRIIFALHRALDRALHGKPCRPSGPNMKIFTAGERARYPDALVTCAPVDPKATVAPDPVVVFEVVSAGSARDDRITKLREYQATPSIQRYVILEQDSVAATVIERRGDAWAVRALTEEDALLMPEIGVEIPVAEFYEGVEMPGGGDGEPAPETP